MTIKLGDIALAPNKYEAYVYRFTNSDNGKIYIGFHKGSTVDKYQHSSKSKEFNEAFANSKITFIFDVISYGSMKDMKQLEYEKLTEVDARNNDLYYNQTNGQQQYARVDLKKVKSLIEDINNGKYPKILEPVDEQVEMEAFQVRYQHDDIHQQEITQAVDLANGDTENCFGKGQGLRVIVFQGRGTNGGDLRVDGNHSVYGASKSKHSNRIGVIYIPYEVNSTLNDAEMRTFCNLSNPRSKVRRKETDKKTGVKYLLDCHEINGISFDSPSHEITLKEMGFSGTLYTGDIGDIINRSKDLYEKENGKKVDGRKWINYKASPSIGVIDKKVDNYNLKDGWCSIKCSSEYYRTDRILDEIYKSNLALEEGDTPITKCKVHVFHPNPSSIKKFPNVLRHWKKVEKMTLSKRLSLKFLKCPHGKRTSSK